MLSSVQSKPRPKPRTMQEVLQRYPRLTGHLICESLGYFAPEAAANAILHHIRGEPFCCEYYTHLAGGFHAERVLKVGRERLALAFRYRHTHHGYMAEYRMARTLVDHVRGGGQGPVLASWF